MSNFIHILTRVQQSFIFLLILLGRGSGSFGGGLLIATLGTREAFRYMGLIAFLGGVLYGLLHYFWLKNINMTRVGSVCDPDTGENIGKYRTFS